MDELRVSATDFRVHLKDLGNQVARGGGVVIVSRHGLELGVFINLREYEEFRRFQEKQGGKNVAPAVVVPMEHPDHMPVEEVERIYNATAAATDSLTLRWRGWAMWSLKARTGRHPGGPPS
jgi:prevent-host-death family protein